MHVRDIHTSHLLTSVRAVYSVIQHIVLPQSGSTDTMTEVDMTVMICLMTKRRINLVRLILDFTIAAVNANRRRHAILLYGMFLTKIFIKLQLPLDGHRPDNERPSTTMKTFSALSLKPHAPEKEKEEKKKDKKKEDSSENKTRAQKEKSKPSGEEKKKKKLMRLRQIYRVV